MSHAKPAAASGPAFDFSTDNAPLDLSLLREHDQGRSLMDRAQRPRKPIDDFGDRAQALRDQAATSTLPQEVQLAALDRQSRQFADAERTQLSHRRLRERYDAAELARDLQGIAAIADPAQQRASLTALQGSYAGFALHPEIAQRIDRQFAEFEPVVQRREQASLRAAIAAGRYAPTLSDARQLYPGRKITTLFDPASRATVFVPEEFADPYLEAEAVQVIQNAFDHARATGNSTLLAAALDDPAVRQVSRIPGNQASAVYNLRLATLSARTSTPAPVPASASPADFYLGGDYSVRPRQTGVLAARPQADDHLVSDGLNGQSHRSIVSPGSGDDRGQPQVVAGRPLRYPPAIRARKPIPQRGYTVDPLANFPLEGKTKWDYSRNERIIDVPAGMTVEQALGLVRKDFEEFKQFSVGNNNIAEAVVDKDASRAFFTLEPVRTGMSALLAQNDTTVGVGLKKVGDTQVAVTLANHQLRGIRRWDATDLGDGRISISTEAYEVPRRGDGPFSTIGNAIGTKFMRGDQARVWDNYFENIDKAHFVGAGKAVPFQHAQYPEAIVNPFAEYFKDSSPDSSSLVHPSPGSSMYPVQGTGDAAGATDEGGPLPPSTLTREEESETEGSSDTRKPQSEETDETSAFALGWEWVAGKGPRQRIFREGDKVTAQIQSSPEVIEGRQKMARRIARGDFRELSFGRNAGQEPVLTYPIRFAADLFSNPARAFLGSYGAKAEVMEVNEDSAVVRYTITNRSGLESASRLPVFGYEKRSDGSTRPTLTEMMSFQASTDIKEWSDLIPRSILPDNAYNLDGQGPGSSKEQAIIWFETLPIKTKRR